MLRTTLRYIGPAILFLGMSAVISATPWTPTVRVVGQPSTACPDAKYATITDAVHAAAAGDEIDICPALYPEQLMLSAC